MGDIAVRKATFNGSKIDKMTVEIHGLPPRTIGRETAVSWMKDGHSLIPLHGGTRLAALQLVECADGHVIRTDNVAEDADQLPDLPSV